jgi:hypothetical protein
MIPITQEESEKIREKYPKVCISRTVKEKHGKRGKRYCPEEIKYMEIIQDTNERAKYILKYGR